MGSLSRYNTSARRYGYPEPLAVIGLSFRFPEDAVSDSGFWNMMMEKRCASIEVPSDRYNVNAHYHPNVNRIDNISARGGHYVKGDIGAFDAPFFSIGATEAQAMDPAQRLTLETAYHAIENAGISIERFSGTKTCVFTGSFSCDYATMLNKDSDFPAKYHGTGSTNNMQSNRVSWFFNLTGPSATIDTACSSSLIALDLVCQSIWNGDSDMGLACGNNVLLLPESLRVLDNLGMIGKDSRCYSFDHRANGYARGEGFGVLVVKRLVDALDDGDTIRAVIRSSCSNQDGKTPGLTMPSKEAQERLIRDAYAKAGLDMASTRYFEAHGTGTPVGDPIEAGAIGAAFRTYRSKDEPLYVGSVKSNIGHLEGASGVAGVIKTILALEKGIIPPNSNFEKLNPKIDADFLNIKIPTETTTWPTSGLRRASVQSFGFGGANSHVVLDDAYNFLRMHGLHGNHNTVAEPPSLLSTPFSNFSLTEIEAVNGDGSKILMNGIDIVNDVRPEATPQMNGTLTPYRYNSANNVNTTSTAASGFPSLLVWSTADEGGIARTKTAWHNYFSTLQLSQDRSGQYVRDLAHTLAVRRSSLLWRTFTVAKHPDDLSSVAEQMSMPIRASASPALAYVFTGQGSQWYAMGRELLFRYPVFRNSLIKAGTYLQGLGCTWDPVDELLRDEKATNVNHAEYSQPLCTILQIALVDLMSSFGIQPRAVVGHSSGEIAAAFCTGAISRQSAWKIAYQRGKVAAKLFRTSKISGAMMAVGLSRSEVEQHLNKVSADLGDSLLTVACVNSPKNVTVSGDSTHLDHLKTLLDAAHIFARKLKVGVAYHSFQMREVADEYLSSLNNIGPNNSRTSQNPVMVSSVTGKRISNDELVKPEYWVRNLVSPVLFSDALSVLCSHTSTTKIKKIDGSHRQFIAINQLVEIGPHAGLKGPCGEILRSINKHRNIQYVPTLVRKAHAVQSILETAGHLYCLGHPIDLSCVNNQTHKKSSAETPKTLTSLPEYSFNHTKSYWHESRISRDHRLRRFAKHDLVGVPAADWNPLEAKWRNIIRISDLPWVEEHKINGVILYPAAGILFMAIQAANQLADPTKENIGFIIRNTTFHSALSIPADSPGLEVDLYLRPQNNQDDRGVGWHDFRLCTYDERGWRENCNGSIQIVYASENNEIDKGHEFQEWQEDHQRRYAESVNLCPNKLDVKFFYDHMLENGYGYGPALSLISAMAHNNEDRVTTEVRTFKWSEFYDMPETPQPHIIHPTTFDCILQAGIGVYTKGATQRMPTLIPAYFDKVWVSKKGLSCADAEKIRVHGIARRVGAREGLASVVAMDWSGKEVLVEIENLKTMDVAAAKADDVNQEDAIPNLCHSIDWKPDLDLLSAKQIQKFCDNSLEKLSEPVEFFSNVDFLLTATAKRILKHLNETTVPNVEANRNTIAYLQWMRQYVEDLEKDQATTASIKLRARLEDQTEIDLVEEKLASTTMQGAFYTDIAQNHYAFLTGNEVSLNSLAQGELFKDIHEHIWNNLPCVPVFQRLLDAIVHKKPSVKILEVGASNSAATIPLMKILTTHGDGESCALRCGTYDCTDKSNVFVSEAQKLHKSYDSKMAFKTLDIEMDPESQGFERGGYDILVAAMTLSKTSDVEASLRHCRKLLKAGGKLFLWEMTSPNAFRTNFAAGLLNDWWPNSNAEQSSTSHIDEHRWDELLKQTSFSGNEIVLRDYQNDVCHEYSIICTTAVAEPPISLTSTPTSDGEIVIVYGHEQMKFAHDLQNRYQATGCFKAVHISTVEQAMDLPRTAESILVFLLELDRPFWFDVNSDTFKKVQHLLTYTSTSKKLWVCQEANQNVPPPFLRLVDGLSRTINSENDSATLTCLTLENLGQSSGHFSDEQMDHIVQLCKLLQSPVELDTEFVERDGILHIPRLIEASKLNDEIYRRELPRQTVQRPWASDVPVQLALSTPGLLNTLHFVEDKDRDRPLAPHEIEIEIKSAGINFRDILIALGRLSSDEFGCECAGVVTRIGSGCQDSGLQVGDRVAGCCFDTYQTFTRTTAGNMVKIPDWMSFSVAASVPINFCTAWRSFADIARLQPGETVLIHSAAGGTGQAAVQVALHLGAVVFATVGTETKKQFLIDRYGIPAEHIFSSRDTTFARGVKRLTAGLGVDVVFNSLSGEGLAASWECIAPFGRFIEIGKKDIMAHNNLQMYQFAENVSFSGMDVSLILRQKPKILGTALKQVFTLMSQDKLTPVGPLQMYGPSEIERAFRTMQAGKTSGKLVVDYKPEEMIEAVIDTKPSFSFDPNATYIIAGGLGGLGRSVANWFVDRGARNLLILSRSGAHNPNANELVTQLAARGAHIQTPVCDICDRSALEAVLADAQRSMPPIRGCIQASMVLRDAIFESMTFDAWQDSTKPKVQGTWNLHTLLPSGLDFFIMFSSVAGIVGSKGQSNYAAGNTFQDAVAQYRIAQGERATALDLGPFFSVGVIAEKTELQNRWKDLVDRPVTETDLFTLLDYYCNPDLGKDQTTQPTHQAIIGLARGMLRESTGQAYYLHKPMFQQFAQSNSADNASNGGAGNTTQIDMKSLFTNATSAAEAGEAVKEVLARKLASMLALQREELDTTTPLHSYGVDSLVAVELRNWFAREVHADIAIFDILSGATIASVSVLAAGKSAYRKAEWVE